MVVAVTVVWTVEPCLIMVVGVTGRARSDAPGAYRTAGEMIFFTNSSPFFVSFVFFISYRAGCKTPQDK